VTDAATLAGHLVSAGLDEAERAAKAQLFQRTLDRWQRDIGTAPAAAWWVPGRLEVFGTHTDYAGGRSLVAPVPRGFVFLAASRLDRQIRAIDAKDVRDPGDKKNAAHQESVAISQEQSPARFRGWRHYVEVTASRLARNFPGSELGTDIAFASDLPRAAGMSSSSALIVGIAISLSYAGRLRERSEWQADVRSIVDEAGYLGCVENGRAFGALTGDAGVGTHGGSEDHAAMLAGTASQRVRIRSRDVETVSIPPRGRRRGLERHRIAQNGQRARGLQSAVRRDGGAARFVESPRDAVRLSRRCARIVWVCAREAARDRRAFGRG
jgi:galactokinase